MDIQNQSYSEIVAKMAAKHREIELLAAFKKAEEQIKKNYEKEQEDRIKDIKEDLEDDFYTLVIEEAKLKIQLEEIQILEEKSEKQREEAMEKAKKEYEEMYSQLPMYMQAELPKVEEGSENTFTYPTYSLDEMKLINESLYESCKAQIKTFFEEDDEVSIVKLDESTTLTSSKKDGKTSVWNEDFQFGYFCKDGEDAFKIGQVFGEISKKVKKDEDYQIDVETLKNCVPEGTKLFTITEGEVQILPSDFQVNFKHSFAIQEEKKEKTKISQVEKNESELTINDIKHDLTLKNINITIETNTFNEEKLDLNKKNDDFQLDNLPEIPKEDFNDLVF